MADEEEPFFRSSALSMKGMFDELVLAGFTQSEALHLVSTALKSLVEKD